MTKRPPPERRTEIWEPPDELTDLMGPVSGNELNGHGEPDPRRPTLVMWDWKRDFVHRPMQDLISERHREHPGIVGTLRLGTEPGHVPVEIGARKVRKTPQEWTSSVSEYALEHPDHAAMDVGVAAVRPEWVFEHATVTEPWIIVMAVEMDFDELAAAPSWRTGAEVQRGYNTGAYLARDLADWIRAQGYQARGHGGPNAGPVLMIPPALAAGLGELGKHGSIIHPELGSRFRLASVLTDLPLQPSESQRFGAFEFCWNCRVCLDACPPGAIHSTEQLVRGDVKWYVDFDRCLPYFAETYSCGICLAVCPWSKPGEAERLVGTMSRKLARQQAGAENTDHSQEETGRDGDGDR